MAETIRLDSRNFSTFLSVVDIIKASCQDMIIKEGKICQTNNKKSAIFQIDLTHLFNENDLLINHVANKADLLDPYGKQQVDVDIVIGDRDIVFKDTYSKVMYKKPAEQSLTNKYVSDEIEKRLSIDQSQGKIFEYTLNKHLIDRLAAYSKALSASKITIEFKDKKAEFKISSSDNSSSTVGNLVTVEDINDPRVEGLTAFEIECFKIGADEISVEAFHRTDKSILLKLSASIGFNPQIPIIIWCISKLVKEEEHTEEDEDE